jgi:hypothetical protein
MSRSNPIEIGEEEEQKNEGAGYAIHKKKNDDSESGWGDDWVEVNKHHTEESGRFFFS